MARRPPSRPGARLGVVVVVLLALYSTMVGTGHTSPKLGLDLQGGTSVILTPKAVNGVKPNKAQLNTAVDIIRQRVNGLGVADAQVVTQGTNVIVSVPGKGRGDVLSVVGQTASLSFREIQNEAQTNPPPGGKPLPSASGSPSGAPATPSARAPGTATPTPQLDPSANRSSKPMVTTSRSSSASSTARPRPVDGALLATTPTPTPTPAAKASAVSTKVPAASPTRTAASTPAASSSRGVESAAPGPAPTVGAGETDQTAPTAAELAAFQSLNCAANGGRPPVVDDDPHHFVVACDRSQPVKYLLKPAGILGTDVSGANATIQQSSSGVSTGNWVVDLTFKDKAISKVEAISGRLFAANMAPLAITLDGIVQSAPATNAQLGKNVEISGGSPAFTQKEASDLANVLKYGSLPVPFTRSDVTSISASLGRSSLSAGLLAGGIGLALVLVYVFIYYRALGIVTTLSLLVSGLMVYACVALLGQLIGFTLTLAGIAGLIVSVGITADSFVVFFERLKDEIREGRSARTAVEYGWVRARRTIFTADTVSFLAAVILYLVSVGDVAGFAFTLGLSTVLDIFTVLLFTKPMVSLLIRYPLFSTRPASGLAPARVGKRRPTTAAKEA